MAHSQQENHRCCRCEIILHHPSVRKGNGSTCGWCLDEEAVQKRPFPVTYDPPAVNQRKQSK